MDSYKTTLGTVEHLSVEDLLDLAACLLVMARCRAFTRQQIVLALDACLILSHGSRTGSPDLWHVIHDEDLITLHRHDDDKPVLLFTKRSM